MTPKDGRSSRDVVRYAGALLALWATVSTARAQELPPAPGVPEVAGETDAGLPLTGGLAEWRWERSGPLGVAPIVSVTVSDGGRVAVASGDGTAWVSEDGGRSWRDVLAPAGARLGEGSRDEAALFDAEIRLQELLDDLEMDEAGVVEDDEVDAAADALEDAVDRAADAAVEQLQSDALERGWFAETEEADGRTSVALAWVDEDVLLVGRDDGLWRVDGAGAVRVGMLPVRALARLPGRRWVVGGPAGLAWSDDLQAWSRVPTPQVDVADLARVGTRVVAATASGLWWTEDGVQWRQPQGPGPALHAVHGVQGRAGRVWAADTARLLRSDDGGASWVAPVGPPLRETADVASGPGPRVLVAAEGGAYLSRDDGGSFVLVRGGLPDGAAHGVAWRGERPWVATDGGAFTLVPERTARPRASVDDDFPDVGTLIGAADARVGLRSSTRLGPFGQAMTWLVPQITLDARIHTTDRRASTLGGGLSGRRSGDWSVVLWATWQPPGRNLVADDPTEVVVRETATGTRLYAGDFDQWMMLGSVSRDGADIQTSTARRIASLHANRALLIAERARADGTLRDRVHLELRIAETEAWLDALTDGAATRIRDAQRGGRG